MPLTGKQKRFLRARMVTQPAIIQIGKGGVNENLMLQIEEALLARELIKIKLFDTSGLELKATADMIAETLKAELVQLIGSNLVLYRRHPSEPKIELPGSKTISVAESKRIVHTKKSVRGRKTTPAGRKKR